jgi:aldehyde:ferredoxin oxidoreductase
MGPLLFWLSECYREGLVSESHTGLPLSKFGSAEFIEELTRKIAMREGFGDTLADGTLSVAETLGNKAMELAGKYIATSTSETRDYDPRLLLTTALMLATEPRRPITQLHGISGNVWISWVNWANKVEGAFLTTEDLREIAGRFWGGAEAVDFSTYRGKALAAKKVQDRVYVNESMILCDVHWPMMVTSAVHPDGHVGDPTLESRIYTAITGRQTEENELSLIGERIFNLQRAIQMRQGWGGRAGDRVPDYFHTQPLKHGDVFFDPGGIMPGPDGNTISCLNKVLDRDEYDKMLDDYYGLRGWDRDTGFQTSHRLTELGLGDIAQALSTQGLVV